MDTPADLKTARGGFTLVEMLVVIVIIGILVGLTAAALGPVRIAARNAAINAEIVQLDMALENYKNEYDEYPPTFIDVNIVVERGGDPLLQQDGRNAVLRHLRKAFPRYVPGRIRKGTWASPNPDGRPDTTPFECFANDVYYSYGRLIDPLFEDSNNPAAFDPASALVFWLGGLPEQVPAAGGQWIPAGFHTDPEFPFKPGTPRTQPLFQFDPERIAVSETHYSIPWDSGSAPAKRSLRYYPDHVDAPYVYFRARRRGANWQYGAYDSSDPPVFYPNWYFHSKIDTGILDNICVAYRDPQDPPFWRNHDTFQIIAAGLDGQFGTVSPVDPSGVPTYSYRVTKTGVNFNDPVKGTSYDYDNLANFCDGATLEDEIE